MSLCASYTHRLRSGYMSKNPYVEYTKLTKLKIRPLPLEYFLYGRISTAENDKSV